MKRRNPHRLSTDARPIAPILAAARAEAERARHGYIGVEHLLITLALPSARSTRQLLAEHHITPERAREAVWLVVGSGRGDGPRFDATTLLATLGIDLGLIRDQVEQQFGPDAIHRLYRSEVGWNLRPRGPLCGLPMAPHLKRAIGHAIGTCWDNGARRLHERLLLGALETDSRGLAAVLGELNSSGQELKDAVQAHLRLAG